MEHSVVAPFAKADDLEALEWLAKVLTSFAKAEQAIGRLSLSIDLPIQNGPLGSINALRARLTRSDQRLCLSLEKRIARWQSLRPLRHLLAHATVRILYDAERRPILVTRHLPLDKIDTTPDRLWEVEDRIELLRVATSDGRSIHDQVANLLSKPDILKYLRKPCPPQ